MLKYFIAFSVLIHLVSSRATLDERQWQESDARQNCSRICTKACNNCTRAIVCSDSEVKCPDNDDNVHNDCPRDEICVPAGCQCKRKILFPNLALEYFLEIFFQGIVDLDRN